MQASRLRYKNASIAPRVFHFETRFKSNLKILQMTGKKFRVTNTLAVNGVSYRYFDLKSAETDRALAGLARLPFSLKVIAENLLRHSGARDVSREMLQALARGEHVFEVPVR